MSEYKFSEHDLPELDSIVRELCAPEPGGQTGWRSSGFLPMPSLEALEELMSRLRAVLFPGFYGMQLAPESMRYHMAANLDSIYRLLELQIQRGHCFSAQSDCRDESCFAEEASRQARRFMNALPRIRSLLAGDVQAAYEGDPAAKTQGETIFCYPSIQAMIHHRIAHELYLAEVPLIPRIISEMSHSRTGIDIHPGARIGENFFIDHGTGVVIGETSIIGRNCRLYQGVTLGALSFPKEDDGTLVKGRERHPVLENDVTVYAGATILGRVTIGAGSIIGGNVWITYDVPEGSKVVQQRSTTPGLSEKVIGS